MRNYKLTTAAALVALILGISLAALPDSAKSQASNSPVWEGFDLPQCQGGTVARGPTFASVCINSVSAWESGIYQCFPCSIQG